MRIGEDWRGLPWFGEGPRYDEVAFMQRDKGAKRREEEVGKNIPDKPGQNFEL